MDHQKSSPDMTTVYQIAVIVLLVACLSVLAAILLKTGSTQKNDSIAEYSHALQIWDIEYRTWKNLHDSTTNQEQLSNAKKGLDSAIYRVKRSRERLNKFDPIP